MKPLAILKNWSRSGNTLSGNVYDHPRFADGTFVRTSSIVNVLPNSHIETRNTVYALVGEGV